MARRRIAKPDQIYLLLKFTIERSAAATSLPHPTSQRQGWRQQQRGAEFYESHQAFKEPGYQVQVQSANPDLERKTTAS